MGLGLNLGLVHHFFPHPVTFGAMIRPTPRINRLTPARGKNRARIVDIQGLNLRSFTREPKECSTVRLVQWPVPDFSVGRELDQRFRGNTIKNYLNLGLVIISAISHYGAVHANICAPGL